MTEMLVWILVAVSFGKGNDGTSTVIGHFKTESRCRHVASSIPNANNVLAKCIQTNILLPK